MLVPAPFDSDVEELRAKMEVASKPRKEAEEEDTEGVDLYKDAFSLAHGTLTLLLMQDAPETRALPWPPGTKPVRQDHPHACNCA